MEKGEPSDATGGNANWCSHSNKKVPQKLKKNQLPYDPVITLVNIYSEDPKPLTEKMFATCVPGVSFTMAKTQEQT